MSTAQPISFPAAATSLVEKENAPLRQSTLLSAFDKGASKGRKRTITLANAELDLSASSIPVTAEAIEAMRLRILELEDELSAQLPPAKRAKTTPAAASASASTSTAASSKAEEKKRKMQVKKIFDRLKKECKSDAVKFQGGPKSIKFEEVLEQSEFDGLFAGKGRLIQPTPANKPKSTVTIIEFNTPTHIQNLFGDELKPLKGNLWSRGGVPTRRMGGGFGGLFGGGGSTFSKSVKHGTCDVAIQSVEISYSRNNMKCTLKFEVAQLGGGGGMYDSDDDQW
ncbi:hypothetical protein GGX14DRAFT_589424 [Mycena pura]|uniref:Uncharacterized protein n=1 Tax=Mycena pura TaxID=153505 RepID=A0AAD6UVQ7_9AGAR|nr:hypothetical protein GGX14DRAFT_589424 [Mycena pura]